MWFAIVGILAAAAGLAAGLFVGRAQNPLSARIRKLEEDLSKERGVHREYRERVADHFEETSHRFQTLTRQYREVYEHLASGARELSPDRVESFESGVAGRALLGERADRPSAEPAEPESPGPGPDVGESPSTHQR